MANKETEWYKFANSYANMVISSVEFYNWCDDKQKNKIKGIYFSLVYNLKHSIELYLKILYKHFHWDYTKQIKKHNISDLFQEVEKLYNSKKIDIDNYFNSLESDDVLESFAIEQWKDLLKTIKEVEKIVIKYFELKFIGNANDDTDNTVFKYPEVLDYGNVYQHISDDKIDGIAKDMWEIKWLFNGILLSLMAFEEKSIK